MSKLAETFARKVPKTKTGTAKHWDSLIKGLVFYRWEEVQDLVFSEGCWRPNSAGSDEATSDDFS